MATTSGVVGKKKRENGNGWYDEESKLMIKLRNEARLLLLCDVDEENRDTYANIV